MTAHAASKTRIHADFVRRRAATFPVAAQRSPVTAQRSRVATRSIQSKASCSCGGGCSRCQTATPAPAAIRPSLFIGAVDDPLEREAKRVADAIMHVRSPTALGLDHRAPIGIGSKSNSKPTDSGSAAPPVVHEVLQTPGRALEEDVLTYFEPRFGRDLSHVRVHTDGRAAQSASAVNAKAYTVGNHVVFGHREYQPETPVGRRLLAHELTHVVQQEGSSVYRLQRDATDDQRLEDPNFLVCVAFCYIGLPPNIWRTLVNGMLRAVSAEYREKYGEARGSAMFREFAAVFSTWSFFNKAKAVIMFLGESRVGFITIEHASAQALRRPLLRVLERAGVRSGAMVTASQIIRKVALVLEAAWAAGCFAYCTIEQYVVLVRDLSLMAIEAAVSALETAQTILESGSSVISQAIRRGFLRAQAVLDISNWRFAPELPNRARRHLNVIATASRLALDPDSFLAYVARTLSSFNLGSILAELAEDLNSAMANRGGFSQIVRWDVASLEALTPLTLINLLVDYGLINYIRSPDEMVDRQEQVQ
jgi:hypothetical protein